MSAAPLIGLILQAVASCDGFFDIGRSAARSVGDAVLEHRGATVVETIGNLLLRLHLARAGAEYSEKGKCEQKEVGKPFHTWIVGDLINFSKLFFKILPNFYLSGIRRARKQHLRGG